MAQHSAPSSSSTRAQSARIAPSTKWFLLRTILGSILIMGGVIALLAAIAYIKTLQIKAAMSEPPPPEMPVAVVLATAEPTQFRQSTVVVGTVLASESILLQTELTGLVTEVRVKPGDTVKRGDLLVQLDVRDEQAQLKSATAARDLAEANLKRNERLSRVNAGTESDLEIAQAEFVRAGAVIEELKVRIDRKQLKAPFDARVGLFDLHIGQYLVEGSRITTLEGIADFFHIDFSMPAHVADAVKIGDEIEIRVDERSEPVPAKVIAIDSAANRISRAVTARAKLEHPPVQLQPNDSVRVTVEYGVPISASLIPATSVRRGPTGTFVFRAEESTVGLRAYSQPVTLGGNIGAMTRVVTGIEPGDRIVADGSFKVMEGSLVADVGNETTSESADAEQKIPLNGADE